MTLNTASRKFKKVLLILVVVMAFLAACTPAGTVTPEPALTEEVTTPSTPTIMVTAPPIPTPLPTRTPLPSPTPTATLSPEEAAQAEQAAIRAEVLSYGINLDDLAHSDNGYIHNHPSVERFQEELNNNFKSGEAGTELMVMLDLEQLHSADEYEESITTDGGWKFLVWARVAYKGSDGDWYIVNMPLTNYHEGKEMYWFKYPQPSVPWYWEEWEPSNVIGSLKFDGDRSLSIGFVRNQIYGNENYRLDTGDLFRLNTSYPEPDSSLNAGEVGETPRYSREELAYFWQTGDPSIFEYQTLDGTYVIWPFVTSSTITTKDYQPIQ